MQKLFPVILLLVSVLVTSQISAQQFSFEDLIVEKELNPSIYLQAKKTAINEGLPVSIKLQDGILIDVLKYTDGAVLYSIIKNPAHPFLDGEVLTYAQITQRFNLSNAEINWGVSSNETHTDRVLASQLLLVPDWTNDNVLSFDPVTGDLVNANFVQPSPGILGSPKHAIFHPNGFISISDQITDLVQKFDTAGVYTSIMAPAGGVNTALLDNLRGHEYRPTNGNLIVTVGSSANQNSVAEFDLAGNYIGQFIATGAGGLNSPFCILFRDNDVLVTGSSSDAAHRYDLNGTYLNDVVTGVQFPQQIIELPNGNLVVCVFSPPSGLGVYDSVGVQINFFTAVTGLRGVYRLPSGNYLVTNGGGLHEIDGTNGSLIRTIHTSANMQYISFVDFNVVPVELVSFRASVSEIRITLNWQSATEKNNSGFEIERSADNINYAKIGFVNGHGTTTEPREYNFTDNTLTSGKYFYRLKQIDYDGTFEYSNAVEAEIGTPNEFSLEQNYPNPFNPTTTIRYTVADAYYASGIPVRLVVYDILGNEVITLVNENKPAGHYEVQFNAEGLSSGVYYYKLSAGSFSETKKLTLIK